MMPRSAAGLWLILLLPITSSAQGINTNVALPVAQGEAIWRSQLRFARATDDPTAQDRKRETLVAPQTLVYGVTPRLTAFATLPILAQRKLDTGLGTERDSALGNLTLLGRATFYVDDYAPLSTRRAAVLMGVELPTGADRFGSPTFRPILGAVATWAANRHELDLDGLFTLGTRRHGVESADLVRYDVAYRYRLWPARFEGRLLQLGGLLELNGAWEGRRRDHGRTARDSGGARIFLSPGLQLVALRWIAELSFQIPVAQHRRGDQLETDFVAVLGVRVPFTLD